jgi:hypothetical protein
MKLRRRNPVPAFLSIDVEPDAMQISPDRGDPWLGYAATYEFVQSLRIELARTSGAKPVFGWYFRMDPQIERVCGRPDFAMQAFPKRIDTLRQHDDYFGVHPHAMRWSAERKTWVHDFSDRQWLRFTTQFALDAFADCTGARPRVFRGGAGFLSDDIVDVIDREGVEAELGLEPVAGWGLRAKVVPGVLDKSPIVGEYTNCASAPKTPYHPSHENFLKPGNTDARRILMIPLTTGVGVLPPRGLIARLRRHWHGHPGNDEVRVLYPTEDDWTERGFWDLIAHRIDSMERPYVSLGIRTDRLDSFRAARVCRVFRELLRHPLAKRLRFVHPLDVKDAITPRPASPAAAHRTASRIPRGASPGFARRGPRAEPHAAAGGRSTGR